VSEQSLDERLASYEGKEVGPPERGADAVNIAMIRHWVEAMGDANPVYLDEDAARQSAHGGIVAPPVMLQAWVMRGITPRPETGGALTDELYRLLDAEGYSSVVATNCEQEYHREVRPGDHLSAIATIESVSPEKKTALGVGRFVTTRIKYVDDKGEPVADMLFRILKFKPPAKSDATEQSEKPPRPRPALTHDNTFFFDGAKAGKLLIQRCGSCGELRHPPRPVCPHCRSYDWDTVEASGRGTVYSFVVNHYPQVPAFDYPLPVGLIELEEGTRLISDIIGIDPADIKVGMPVQVEFVKCDDELTLPMFRPVA
jgi:uncharacterized OB-fold protein/acyl dehydratase